MKDKKVELDQTTAMSEMYHRKCLRPTEILSQFTNVLPCMKTPEEMNQDDSPFNLTVNNTLKKGIENGIHASKCHRQNDNDLDAK